MDPRLKQAIDLNNKGNLDGAEALYHELLNEQPNDPAILLLLGALANRRGNYGASIAFSRQAIKHKPDFAEAFNNLGVAFRQEGNTEEALRAFRKSLELKEHPETYNNLAACFVNEGCPDKGIIYAEKAMSLDPGLNQAYWNKSLCLLEQGKFKEGFELYEYGFKLGDRTERQYNCPWWNGEKDKSVVVFGEQGLGDEIMFASFLPQLIADCKQVYFDCHPRLVNLFKRAFLQAKVYGTRKDEYIKWVQPGMIDAKVAIGSLPRFYGMPAKQPYLSASPLRLQSDKPVIGISWAGGKKKTRNDLRSLPLDSLLPILKQDATFISLQYTESADAEIAAFEKAHGITLHHWPEIVRGKDYDVTASIVMGCDLIISVNTSLVHLCGALGKECWVLTPSRPAWRYQLEGERMPFYGDHITQFRQDRDNWLPPIRRIAEALQKRLQTGFRKRLFMAGNQLGKTSSVGEVSGDSLPEAPIVQPVPQSKVAHRPTVILVGHGPSMMVEPMGMVIDEYDYVVRMKRCKETLRHPAHFGTKTDVVSGSYTLGAQLRQVDAPAYWIFLDSRHDKVTQQNIERMTDWYAPRDCIIDRALCDEWNAKYRELRNQIGPVERHPQMEEFTPLGHDHLSAGLLTLVHACKYLNPEKISLIGCDNLATGEFSWSITRGPDWDKYPDHRWDVEHRLIPMIAEHFGVQIDFLLPDGAVSDQPYRAGMALGEEKRTCA